MTPEPRRTLAARLAGTFAALLAAPALAAPLANDAEWPSAKSTRHRLLVDAYEVNGGQPLAYAETFLTTNQRGTASAVLVLRHNALPLALPSALWAKYGIGEFLGMTDPATKLPTQQNPHQTTLTRLIAAGVAIGACNVALHGQSHQLAAKANLTPEQAEADWAANLLPGITLIPSGVWGVGRAQEAGCAYCTGGG